MVAIVYHRVLFEDHNYGHSVAALNCTAKPKSPAVWACLGVNPLDMNPRNPLSGEWKKTLLILHNALSPHPHIIICTSFILWTDYTVFNALLSHSNDH